MPPRIGFLGGTFDPVHYGHINSVNEVLHKFDLDRFELIPCKIHPLQKKPQANAQQRVDMLELAVSGYENLHVNSLELMRNTTSYTIDTLIELRTKWGEQAELFFVMGSDAFAQLDQWHRWKELVDYVNLIVLRRADDLSLNNIDNKHLLAMLERCEQALGRERIISAKKGELYLLSAKPQAISSTSLRQGLASMTHEEMKTWIPQEVINYMRRESLYGMH